MEEFVKATTLLLARWIEAGAALVIAVASVRLFGRFLFATVTDRSLRVPKEEIRLSLGRIKFLN